MKANANSQSVILSKLNAIIASNRKEYAEVVNIFDTQAKDLEEFEKQCGEISDLSEIADEKKRKELQVLGIKCANNAKITNISNCLNFYLEAWGAEKFKLLTGHDAEEIPSIKKYQSKMYKELGINTVCRTIYSFEYYEWSKGKGAKATYYKGIPSNLDEMGEDWKKEHRRVYRVAESKLTDGDVFANEKYFVKKTEYVRSIVPIQVINYLSKHRTYVADCLKEIAEAEKKNAEQLKLQEQVDAIVKSKKSAKKSAKKAA